MPPASSARTTWAIATHRGQRHVRPRGSRSSWFVMVPAQAIAANWISSFKEFPPRQKPASFSLEGDTPLRRPVLWSHGPQRQDGAKNEGDHGSWKPGDFEEMKARG